MSNVYKINNDDIDLVSLLQILWDGKWKIVSIIAFALLSFFGFNNVKSNTTFTASTYIKPISSFEFAKYSLFNSSLKIIKKVDQVDQVDNRIRIKTEKEFIIFAITSETLLNLYIEEIEEGSLLETGIDKFNLINKDNFDSETAYKQAIEKFASDIKVLRPVEDIKESLTHHVLKATYNDVEKWKQLLSYVDYEANRKVKANIINLFATTVSIENQKKNFTIKDIEKKIDNVKKDYERNKKARIIFLTEQAAIARKLDIKKNIIASQKYITQNPFITNVKTDNPIYLRGYMAIEEEINQIKNRKITDSFITDLYKLEQQKRALEQDETIQRAEELFQKTPLNQQSFAATSVKVATTDFVSNNKNELHYMLAIILGSIIGVVYVLATNAFASRKNGIISS